MLPVLLMVRTPGRSPVTHQVAELSNRAVREVSRVAGCFLELLQAPRLMSHSHICAGSVGSTLTMLSGIHSQLLADRACVASKSSKG